MDEVIRRARADGCGDEAAAACGELVGVNAQGEPGARAAFEMIVTSFATGDRETLRPLLSDEVYENFAGAIVERARMAGARFTGSSVERVVGADSLRGIVIAPDQALNLGLRVLDAMGITTEHDPD